MAELKRYIVVGGAGRNFGRIQDGNMAGDWIAAYGIWAVLVGGVLEGEVVFIAAGYAISQGYLPLGPTLLVATLGGSLGDHLFYLAGRGYGTRLVQMVPALRTLRAHAIVLLRRWGRAAAFATRFAYGLRTVLPLSMGAARYRAALFIPFNLLGALVFAGVYLTLGYAFGEAAGDLLEQVLGQEHWILLGIGASGLLVWAIREWRLFHSRPSTSEEGAPK